jgi:hypothetical protein
MRDILLVVLLFSLCVLACTVNESFDRILQAVAPRPVADTPPAVARLETWGERGDGTVWGIVAMPDIGWSDTIPLVTSGAIQQVNPSKGNRGQKRP